MINYVIYSHTDYLDVLKIQTDFIKEYKNKTLLINKSDVNHELFNEYENIVYYDDSLPYAGRLLALSKLTDEFIHFHHETDIIIKKDDNVIEYLVQFMGDNGIDRIDLQWKDQNKTNPNTEKLKVLDFELSRQLNDMVYNVNPSIWRLSTFLDVHEKHRNHTYKQIEGHNTDNYCRQFKIYKLWGNTPINCGALICFYFFQYFHITRGGKWYPPKEVPFPGKINRIEPEILNWYNDIVAKYELNESNRRFY